jgi:hypothetical protein
MLFMETSGQAEIGKLNVTIFVDQDIIRFDIAIGNKGGFWILGQ